MLIVDSAKAQELKQDDQQAAKAEQRETINSQIEHNRDVCLAPDGDIPTTEAEAQFGRALPSVTVIERLRRLNGFMHFERSKSDPSLLGIYIIDGVSNPGTAYSGMRFVCGMEADENPEFTIRKSKKVKFYNEETEAIDYRLEFEGEVRGWRTVLARLIRAGIIDKSAAEKEFQVNRGRSSQNWQNLVN